MGEWLTIIGLNEYAENFIQNHINGKILFDITEKELKEDLNVVSIGHRKNFQKAVQHLKKFYSKNRLYSDSIKNKLIRFYEKHSHQLKIGGKKDFDLFRPPTQDIIHEDKDEISYKESPAINNLKHEISNNNNNANNESNNEEFQLDIYEQDAVFKINEKIIDNNNNENNNNNNNSNFYKKKSSKSKKTHFITEKKFEDDEILEQKKQSPIQQCKENEQDANNNSIFNILHKINFFYR